MAAFAVATCLRCKARFRLAWHLGGKRLNLTAVVRLRCPACNSTFEREVVKLTVFASGRKEFPLVSAVEPVDVLRVA